MMNPFKPIYEKVGVIVKTGGSPPEFPLLVDVEITSQCNLRCIMCEHTHMKRKQETMRDEIFEKVMQQCTPYKPGIRFIMFSEPFLHPRVIDYAKRVKALGMLLHVTTNGTIVTKDQLDQMMELGLDSITFSLQGLTEQEYSFVRGNEKYETLHENVAYISGARGSKPFIQVSTTISGRDDPKDKDAFQTSWSKYADAVTIGRTSWTRIAKFEPRIADIAGIDAGERSKRMPCQDIMTKMCVLSNGDVTVCCDDAEGKLAMGNVMKKDMKNIWMSDEYSALRTLLKHMKMDMLSVCADCYPAYDY